MRDATQLKIGANLNKNRVVLRKSCGKLNMKGAALFKIYAGLAQKGAA